MNYISLLDQTARDFKQIIEAFPGAEPIPTEDYGWENYRWRSATYRVAHVELFNQDRFMVVHTCIFPHAADPAPIFGFDVIAGDSKVTGLFLDLSPTVYEPGQFHTMTFEQQRDRPEWGDIFSQNWIACRPTHEEFLAVLDAAKVLLKHYLTDIVAMEKGDTDAVVAGQNRYCNQQRQNEHTYRALKNLIGEDRARHFMDTVLFPTL